MLKACVSYILIVFGLAVLWTSTSRTAMQYLTDARDNDRWWGTYQGRHGDLLSMAHLEFVQKFNDGAPFHPNNRKGNKPLNTTLYLHGDSFTRHLKDSLFEGVAQYIYIDRNHGFNYHLDSATKNIMIIEVSERYLLAYFSGLQMLDEVCDSFIKKKNIVNQQITPAQTTCAALQAPKVGDFFNKYINQNLQCNLFNYNFMMPLFEAKAAINYYFFNRASGDVVISDDKDFLFLKETVSKTDIGSSYYQFSAEQLANLVTSLNTIYDHYKANGFDEVYYSVIPNSATINQPAGYNILIPSLQSDPRLRMKIIDIYTPMKNANEVLYFRGDTHWNLKGLQLWLDVVNRTLCERR